VLLNEGGGLGAVSIGVTEILATYGLLVVGSVVANWMLASWARGSDHAIKTLHRAHRWLIGLPFVVVILIPVVVFATRGPIGLVMLPLSGVLWGVQFVLTAALLAAYAVRTSRT